ncbi:hypothetical protein WDU94_012195 [Cyamophila willieti]
MATIPLPKYIAEEFNCEEFKNFKRQFALYIKANELSAKSHVVKVAHLCLALNTQMNDLVEQMPEVAGEEKTVDTVLKYLEDKMGNKSNSHMLHHAFFNRCQLEHESFNSYLIELKKLSKKCDLGVQEENILKFRIVAGLKNKELKESLFKFPELSIDQISERCRMAEQFAKPVPAQDPVSFVEAVKVKAPPGQFGSEGQSNYQQYRPSQQRFGTSNPSHQRFGTYHSSQPRFGTSHPSQLRYENHHSSQQRFGTYVCKNCNQKHGYRQCPAFGKMCLQCKRYGHFKTVCRQNQNDRRVQLINTSENDVGTSENGVYVSELVKQSVSSWYETILIENIKIPFKLDTGADVNVLPYSNYLQLKNRYPVMPSNVVVKAYGGMRLKNLGYIRLRGICKKNTVFEADFLIVDDSQTKMVPILGIEACTTLNLINRVVNNINVVKNKEYFCDKYATVFEGLGSFPTQYEIKINENADPIIHPPRRQPLSVLPKLENALDKLVKSGVIEKVNSPKNWCSNLVVVDKPGTDSVRICLDPTDLNKHIQREYCLIPTIDEIKTKLSGKSIFSVIDLKDSFYQIKLSSKSKDLCTFSTPFGFYRYLRLPFGLISASEVFTQENLKCFGDIPDVGIYIDDIIIASSDLESHLKTVEEVFQRAKKLDIKFNLKKFQFCENQIKYLGLKFSEKGSEPDEDRIKSIVNLKSKELQSLLGMFNFLRSFIPNMSEISAPLRTLLKKENVWFWSEIHENALNKLKTLVSSSPVLKNFDVNAEILIQTDSSQNGLGNCLLQNGQPVAFSSRSLTDTEKLYAQIDKEMLSILFSCRKYHHYIYGKKVRVQTDHLPLVSIFNKNLCNVPSSRLQRMKLQLAKYDLCVEYLPGKSMHVADLLSRNFLPEQYNQEITIEGEICSLESETLLDLKQLAEETEKDVNLSLIVNYCKIGWPKNKHDLPDNSLVRHFWKLRNEIMLGEKNILFYQDRVVVPESVKTKALNMVHSGHLGIAKTRARANQIMYWLNMSSDIENKISSCLVCEKYKNSNQKETLIPSDVPDYPFQVVNIDILTYRNQDFLVLVDSYSKWIEICKLKTKSCSEIIHKLDVIFSNFGIPMIVRSDNSPFNSKEIHEYCVKKSIEWKFSSPNFPQSNGASERAVQTSKNILKKSFELKVSFLDLLVEYRATPILSIGLSPSELLQGRMIRTRVFSSINKLKPNTNKKTVDNIKEKMGNYQKKYSSNFNKNAKPETVFSSGDKVMIQEKDYWIPGVEKINKYPRSYVVQRAKDGFLLRRNSIHLRHTNAHVYEGETQLSDDNKKSSAIIKELYDEFVSVISNNVPSVPNNNVPSISNDPLCLNVLNVPSSLCVNVNPSISNENNIDNCSDTSDTYLDCSDTETDTTMVPISHDHNYLKTTASGRVIIPPVRYRN